MTMKPKVILTEEVIAQMQEYESKCTNLELKLDEEQRKLEQIQLVLQENAVLEAKAKALINEYVSLHYSLWGKTKELYPEIRLAVIQKAVEFMGAASAEGAAAAGGTPPPSSEQK